jgi:hypothetical protein
MRRVAASFAMMIACGTSGTMGASLEPGSPGWLADTRNRLLEFDADRSGSLDAGEVERLPCEVFMRPAREWGAAFGSSFAASHGLGPGLLFRGAALGFDISAAGAVPGLEARCGLADPVSADETADLLSQIESPPTSAEWDARVATILLAGHDLDRSGSIDNRLEIQGIPCGVLAELDRQVRGVADVGVATLYGVESGLVWIGPALGFGDAVRDELGERFIDCELDGDFD